MAGSSLWELDTEHTSVEFAVKHMLMTTVRGRFKELSGTITVDENDPDNSRVEVEVVMSSVDTGSADRDDHLRSEDFFAVDRYPTALFRSKRVEGCTGEEGRRFTMTGDLTIRDSTLEVKLECVFEGRGMDPWGRERIGFGATAELDRREWGLRWNQAMETGGVLVAHRILIEIEAQFVRHRAAAGAAA